MECTDRVRMLSAGLSHNMFYYTSIPLFIIYNNTCTNSLYMYMYIIPRGYLKPWDMDSITHNMTM